MFKLLLQTIDTYMYHAAQRSIFIQIIYLDEVLI